MDAWWIDALLSGFTSDYPVQVIRVFQVLLLSAIAWKFVFEEVRGARSYFDSDAYIRFAFRQRVGFDVPSSAYMAAYALKFVGPAVAFLGPAQRVALALLAAWFAFELSYDFKFHTVYIGACYAILSVSDGVSSFPWGETDPQRAATSWVPFLIVMLTTQMYWSSAFRKLKSRGFMEGRVLQHWAEYSTRSPLYWHYRETWLPKAVHTRILSGQTTQIAKLLSSAAVAAEIMIPVLLLVPGAWVVGVVIGVILHLSFLVLLPVKLLPFSLATTASYAIFAGPGFVPWGP